MGVQTNLVQLIASAVSLTQVNVQNEEYLIDKRDFTDYVLY